MDVSVAVNKVPGRHIPGGEGGGGWRLVWGTPKRALRLNLDHTNPNLN
jgi:hypothetical protein